VRFTSFHQSIILNIEVVTCAVGEPVGQDALDKRCEIWLERVFGLKLDFAIENSLPVCLEDGVIKQDGQVSCLGLSVCLSI